MSATTEISVWDKYKLLYGPKPEKIMVTININMDYIYLT